MTHDQEPEEEDTRPAFLRKRYPRQAPPLHAVPNPLPPSEAGPYAQAALAREVEDLARTPEGQRNHRLNVAGFNLAQLIASGYLDHGSVYQALSTTAVAIGLSEEETRATLRSSLGAGSQHPRQVAQLDQEDPPEATVYSGPANPPEALDSLSLGERFPALDWEALWADESEEEWIVYPILPARRLVALFSPPKVGKSLLMLELAVAVASGTPVLGHHPDPTVVLYVDFENDPRGDIRTRLQAMGRKPQDLENLKYLSYPRLAKLDSAIGGLELLAVAQFYGATVVVIDTISRAVGGEENDNDTWLSFYRNTGVALKAAGISVIRLDHTGKDLSKGMRGGSAKYGDVDVVWSLTRITDTTFRLECTDNRLPVEEKVLVLERKADPLHHAVSTRRTGDVYRDEEDNIIAALDRANFPVAKDWGYGRATPILDEAGVKYRQRTLKAALARRKDPGDNHPQLGRGLGYE